jgi:hypothetical protein
MESSPLSTPDQGIIEFVLFVPPYREAQPDDRDDENAEEQECEHGFISHVSPTPGHRVFPDFGFQIPCVPTFRTAL